MSMIIDGHVHLLPRKVRRNRDRYCEIDRGFGAVYSSGKSRLATDTDIIHYLDESSIDKAVVFGFPWEKRDLVRENNDEVWDFHDRNPDRIIPFAVLPPHPTEGPYREASRTLGQGFAGIGELAMYHGGWSLSDFEALQPSLELAGAKQAPVLIHVNEPVGHHYPGKQPVDFRGLLHIIESNPKVDFILAHWAGGLFFYALMPEVRAILERTYVDTAASPYLYSSEIFQVARIILGPGKILFGSDYPLLPFKRYLKELEKAGVEEQTKGKILGGNMEELLFGETKVGGFSLKLRGATVLENI